MNKSDLKRNQYMLSGSLSEKGYDWWWHSFTAVHRETGKEKSFFIEYFFCNPGRAKKHVIFGEEVRPPSYAMIKVGTWGENPKQVHNFYTFNDVKLNQDPLDIKVGSCHLTEHSIRGNCSVSISESQNNPKWFSDAGKMEWDLTVQKKIAYNVGYGASKLFRAINAFDMFWHAEGIQTFYSGYVKWNEEIYDVFPENCYGYADKNWGKDFTSPWLWISTCHLIRESNGEVLNHSALEIGGGQPKIFGIPLKNKLLFFLYLEDIPYEFNFSKFWKKSRVQYQFNETDKEMVWLIIASNSRYEIIVELQCKKNEMLRIRYESPDGRMRHKNLWNGGTGSGTLSLYEIKNKKKFLKEVLLIKNVGCEFGKY